jgi:hypothetical protein
MCCLQRKQSTRQASRIDHLHQLNPGTASTTDAFANLVVEQQQWKHCCNTKVTASCKARA